MRPFLRLLAVIGCVLAGLGSGIAQGEKRVALVIGNADYKVGPLQNSLNDAVATAELLEKRLGFKVILRQNLGSEAFRAALLELSRESAGADVGLVYFAGHGTEVNGRNFLIPTDAKLAKAGDLDLEAIALDAVLAQLAGVSKLKLVILDACRNNVFALAGGKRSVTRGLGRIEPEENTLVVYAAKDGTTADDGKGKHSPFTEALLAHIATPGLEISFVFRRVRDDVVAATNSVQFPHIYGTLGGKEFYLQLQMNDAEREWARLDKSSIADLETFVRRHGSSPEADYARARIEALKKQTVVVTAPPVVSPPKTGAGAKSGSFDGDWTVTGKGGEGCKLKSWTHQITIKGGTLHASDGSKGTVAPTGDFRYTYKNAANPTAPRGSYIGKLTARVGSGSYDYSGICRGSMELVKAEDTAAPDVPGDRALKGPFDGVWTLNATAKSGCGMPRWSHRVSVRDSDIWFSEEKRGRVEKSGAFTYTFPNNIVPGRVVAASGKLGGETGSGNYLVPGGTCVGTLTASKE
jgi:hypothetical protein